MDCRLAASALDSRFEFTSAEAVDPQSGVVRLRIETDDSLLSRQVGSFGPSRSSRLSRKKPGPREAYGGKR